MQSQAPKRINANISQYIAPQLPWYDSRSQQGAACRGVFSITGEHKLAVGSQSNQKLAQQINAPHTITHWRFLLSLSGFPFHKHVFYVQTYHKSSLFKNAFQNFMGKENISAYYLSCDVTCWAWLPMSKLSAVGNWARTISGVGTGISARPSVSSSSLLKHNKLNSYPSHTNWSTRESATLPLTHSCRVYTKHVYVRQMSFHNRKCNAVQ